MFHLSPQSRFLSAATFQFLGNFQIKFLTLGTHCSVQGGLGATTGPDGLGTEARPQARPISYPDHISELLQVIDQILS